MKLYAECKYPSARAPPAVAVVVALILLGCSNIDLGRAQAVDDHLARTKDIQLSEEINVCPLVGPLLYGDVRYNIGCHLTKQMEEINGTNFDSSNVFAQDKMKPVTIDKLLEEKAQRLLDSTDQVNFGAASDSNWRRNNSDSRTTAVDCCDVTTEIIYPLFGYSLSASSMVRIVQQHLQQGVIYRRCRSKESGVVRGRCRQSFLPRLAYVYHSKDSGRSSGYPYFQDLVLMPSNCECLISLPPLDSKKNVGITEPLNEEKLLSVT